MNLEKKIFDDIMFLYNHFGENYEAKLDSISIKSEDNYFEVWLFNNHKQLMMIFKIEVNWSFFTDPIYKFNIERTLKSLNEIPIDFAYNFLKPIVRDYKLRLIINK
jgi:hypothetical protein